MEMQGVGSRGVDLGQRGRETGGNQADKPSLLWAALRCSFSWQTFRVLTLWASSWDS